MHCCFTTLNADAAKNGGFPLQNGYNFFRLYFLISCKLDYIIIFLLCAVLSLLNSILIHIIPFVLGIITKHHNQNENKVIKCKIK